MKDKNIWNIASYAGLVLGLVSITYMFATQLIATSKIPSFISLALNSILWIAKFAGCIYLMMFYMKKVAKEIPNANNSTTFRFGTITALLSAFVYATATFANTAYISAELMNEQFETVMNMYSKFLDSNSMNVLENMMDKMPQISFFSNLIYCFIYGTVLSSILSRIIPGNDPFAEYKSK